jgi:hypothetical protein
VNTNHLLVGPSRYGGTVVQSGGQMNVATRFTLDSSPILDTGRYTISGGSFISPATTIYDGTIFNFNGGAVSLGELLTYGTIKLSPHGNKVLRASTLYVDLDGHIELANNSMLLTNDTPATAYGFIQQGYADGAWDSPYGITSSFAAATALLGLPHRTALGCGPTAQGTLIRYTYTGDANVDGIVNLADFNALASNFGQTGKLWHQGDFNYDGTVNLSDFNLLASNFGFAALAHDPTPQDWSTLAAVVPEPASLLLLLPGVPASTGMFRRRRALHTCRV